MQTRITALCCVKAPLRSAWNSKSFRKSKRDSLGVVPSVFSNKISYNFLEKYMARWATRQVVVSDKQQVLMSREYVEKINCIFFCKHGLYNYILTVTFCTNRQLHVSRFAERNKNRRHEQRELIMIPHLVKNDRLII